LSRLFASASTWYKIIRERGWNRPRRRIHPAKPKEGLKATRPNQYWHVDTTVIRLTTGIRIYVQAVIDDAQDGQVPREGRNPERPTAAAVFLLGE